MSSPIRRHDARGARLVSLDQFRGYSVAGMFVVNFLLKLNVTPDLLKHNNTFFSYADSIMPSFLFICGMAYRMTYLKRLDQDGPQPVRRRILNRSLGLILLAVMLYGFSAQFATWNDMTLSNLAHFAAELFKANLWEVLAIIGACQILILGVIGSSIRVRVGLILLFGCLHILLSWSFNYEFVYGRPNWMDHYFGAAGKRAWDGGIFGLLCWSQAMLAGTLVYDTVQARRPWQAAGRLAIYGVLLMATAYAMSCLTRLYDLSDSQTNETVAAVSPVLPPWTLAKGRSWQSLLADAPFIEPPGPDARRPNYWMMDKRVVSQSFMLFSIGFAIVLYAGFVVACDRYQCRSSVFENLGQNALAAYIIHHFVAQTILSVVPKDAPIGLALSGLLASFGIAYFFVRFLNQRQVYLRL